MPKDDGRARDGAASGVSAAVDATCGETRVSTFGTVDAGLLTTMLPLCPSRSNEMADTTASPTARATANRKIALNPGRFFQAGELSGARISISGDIGWAVSVTSWRETWADVSDFS